MMRLHCQPIIITVLALLLEGLSASGFAADAPQSAFSLRVENDTVHGTDANYTSGISLDYSRSDSGLLGNVWNSFGLHEGRKSSSYELAQLLFTPTAITLTPPDPHDRPYASLIYLAATTDLQTDTSLHAFQLLAGVIGPRTVGEEAQRLSHRVFGDTFPKGWDYQLKNEPLLNINYEYRRRYQLVNHDGGFGVELIPVGTVMLGNYLTKGRAEAQLRVGYRLPDDFSQTSLRGIGTIPFDYNRSAGNAWGVYLFAGGGGDLVVRDITLDGNSFRNSPSVSRRPLVSSAMIGLSFRAGSVQGSVSYFLCGQEFAGQLKGEQYGSAMLTYLFR